MTDWPDDLDAWSAEQERDRKMAEAMAYDLIRLGTTRVLTNDEANAIFASVGINARMEDQ